MLVADPSSPPSQHRIVAMAEIRKARKPEAEAIAERIEQVLNAADLAVDDIMLLPPRTIGRTSSGKLRRFRWAAVLSCGDFVPLYHHSKHQA